MTRFPASAREMFRLKQKARKDHPVLRDITLPEIAENVTKGTVVKVAVQANEAVQSGQTLVELETEKATVPVPAPESGTIKDILIEDGDEVQVGQVIFKLETAPLGVPDKPAPGPAPAKPADDEKNPPPDNGKPASPTEPSGQTQAFPAAKPEPQPPETNDASSVPAAPSVRRLAREIGVDLTQVKASGPSGRVTEEDVKAHAKALLSSRPQSGTVPASPPLPDFSRWGSVERKPFNNIRKKTAEHLSISWATVPHVTQFEKVDISGLEAIRKKYSTDKRKLTITPFIIKVIVSALKHFPQFNASIDTARNEIIYKNYYHIGVAVDTENGLLVPVVRDADQKSIFELSDDITQLAEKARQKKLSIDEMQGGTFTITNLGGIGGTAFTPIVNYPEVAILGVARARLEPYYQEGKKLCSPALMLPLCLSYDHRIIDGADGARFTRWIADAIEQPFLLELEG